MPTNVSSEAVDLARSVVDRVAVSAFSDFPVDPAGPPIVLLLAEIAVRLERVATVLEGSPVKMDV